MWLFVIAERLRRFEQMKLDLLFAIAIPLVVFFSLYFGIQSIIDEKRVRKNRRNYMERCKRLGLQPHLLGLLYSNPNYTDEFLIHNHNLKK